MRWTFTVSDEIASESRRGFGGMAGEDRFGDFSLAPREIGIQRAMISSGELRAALRLPGSRIACQWRCAKAAKTGKNSASIATLACDESRLAVSAREGEMHDPIAGRSAAKMPARSLTPIRAK